MAYRTENPATGVVEKEYTSATDADVTRAIERADAAFGTWRTTDASERASVLVAGPLGLCFLPAFVCLGVLPVVVGLADGMLPGSGAGLAP